jgi:alpha-L-fucosidase
MKKKFLNLSLIFVVAFTSVQLVSAQYKMDPKMDWWYHDRFGMFIHFGSYSYLGHGEWAFSTENWKKADYQQQVSAHFNPVDFDAGRIARLAKEAGMKYVVITAKHHEGFSMWDTHVKSFKDVTGTKMYSLPGFTPFKKRDILMELKDSCEAAGLKFCLYYSILDWNHSSQQIYHGKDWYTFSTIASDSAKAAYVRDMKAQLKELVERYHPAVLWFDGDWTYNSGESTPTRWWTKDDGADLYNYVISLDPDIIVNERVARSFGLGDFQCPENEVPEKPLGRQWETCRTMNNTWGYNASDSAWKSPDTLIREMVTTVSRDGNYLLNIGPKGDGTVQPEAVHILHAFGSWMDKFGQSIYGTTRSPYSSEPEWGVYTKKEGKLYAHVFHWPEDNRLTIPAVSNKIGKIYLMGNTPKELKYKITDSGNMEINLPAAPDNHTDQVIKIDMQGLPEAKE